MSGLTLERARASHEDIEAYEAAIVAILEDKPRTVRVLFFPFYPSLLASCLPPLIAIASHDRCYARTELCRRSM